MIKRTLALCVAALLLVTVFSGGPAPAKGRKILVFCKTAGYHHKSIAAGIRAIDSLAKVYHFTADTTTDSLKFTAKNLKQYAAVVFLNTTGNVLNEEQQAAFTAFIQSGKGYAGVHAATDTEYDWPWYGGLAGAYFKSHPKIQQATMTVKDPGFIATRHLPQQWVHTDEWYNFKSIATDLHILLTVDEKSYTGGINGETHPVSWYHTYDGGRAFYTALGHTDECYSDPLFLQHLAGGIEYAMGKK